MFAVLYRFEIVPGKKKEFMNTWKDLTNLIYEYEGSLGSRLHEEKKNSFIAYAQWPDKDTWKNSGENLPSGAWDIRKKMRNCCRKIEILFELPVVDDLFKTN